MSADETLDLTASGRPEPAHDGSHSPSGRRPTVSIIIPSYNHGHFVSTAIDSALAQSWGDSEIIVVDDGSTDGTAGVLDRYATIHVVRQANRGLAAARNAGLRASTGDVLIFLDADDILWPDAAAHGVRLLEAHTEAAMVFGRCRLVDEAAMPLPTKLPEIRSRFYEELLLDNYIWTPAMAAFRRWVFDLVGGFDEAISPAADYDMYLRIMRQFPVAAHTATTVDYRQHARNMSRDPVLMLESTLVAIRAQQPYAARDGVRAAVYREAIGRWRVCYGERLIARFRSALRERDLAAAASTMWHLVRLHPAGVRHHLVKKARLMLGLAPGDSNQDSDGGPGVADLSRP